METGFTINGNVAVLHRQVTELTDDEIYDLKQVVYQIGLVVLKEQIASAAEFVHFGLRIGELVPLL
ncbi:MAG: hypothetical protein AB2990_06800 [Candidatus Symbiodolus clandestinus]